MSKNNKNNSLLELIKETLIYAFLWCVSSKEDIKNYSVKEKWKNWFKATFTRNNILTLSQKLMKNISKKVLIILFIFIMFNIVLFSTMIHNNAYKKPYAKAKAYNIAAVTINQTYIFPLSYAFGYKNILTIPFYAIRDALYNKSQSLYPANEGEKEINWFTVRYAEYKTFVHDLVNLLMNWRHKTPQSQVYMIEDWIDELHDHLKPFATEPISDPELRRLRYNMYVNFAFDNVVHRRMLVAYISDQNPKNNYIQPILRDKEQIAKAEDSLIYLQKLQKYAEKNEKEGLNYFYHITRNYYLDTYLTWEVSKTILYSKLVYKELSCDDKYIDIYKNSYLKLDEYYTKDYYARNRLTHLGDLSDLNRTLDVALIKKCPTELKELNKVELIKRTIKGRKENNFFDKDPLDPFKRPDGKIMQY